MIRAVDDVLEEIGAGEVPRLLVLDNIDAIREERRDELRNRHPGAVLVSALTARSSRHWATASPTYSRRRSATSSC